VLSGIEIINLGCFDRNETSKTYHSILYSIALLVYKHKREHGKRSLASHLHRARAKDSRGTNKKAVAISHVIGTT
jgi:hypothetical protein